MYLLLPVHPPPHSTSNCSQSSSPLQPTNCPTHKYLNPADYTESASHISIHGCLGAIRLVLVGTASDTRSITRSREIIGGTSSEHAIIVTKITSIYPGMTGNTTTTYKYPFNGRFNWRPLPTSMTFRYKTKA
jgi:hypothetical protein